MPVIISGALKPSFAHFLVHRRNSETQDRVLNRSRWLSEHRGRKMDTMLLKIICRSQHLLGLDIEKIPPTFKSQTTIA